MKELQQFGQGFLGYIDVYIHRCLYKHKLHVKIKNICIYIYVRNKSTHTYIYVYLYTFFTEYEFLELMRDCNFVIPVNKAYKQGLQ